MLTRTGTLDATGEKTIPQSTIRGMRVRGANALPARASVPPCDPPAMSTLVVAYASPSSVFILRPTPKRSAATTARVKKMLMPTSGMPSAFERPMVPLVPASDTGRAACDSRSGETGVERSRQRDSRGRERDMQQRGGVQRGGDGVSAARGTT